jgi:hypothetical protein
MRRLHPVDPYAGFPYRDYPADVGEVQGNGVLERLISDLRPRLAIEVGCWKGATAIRMASLLKQQREDVAVVCVDTWLGSVEHWDGSVRGWDIRPYLKNDYPSLYYQFLANVLHSGCEGVIVPVPNASSNAARWLRRQGVTADLVCVDGSHEEDDVYQDLCGYWKLLRPGGFFFGDDWHAYWYGVICAVNRFARERDLSLQVVGQKWALQKPAER